MPSESVTPALARRLPLGAEPLPGGGVSFRVWAPKRRRVEVVLEGRGLPPAPLEREADGWFSGVVEEAGAGALYRFRLDGGKAYPDPASRFQPEGPHGPSRVEDPARFRWSDAAWPGLAREGQVLYELHAGTFTPEGTWAAAARELPALAELGVTAIELMPVAEFPGRFGWGYDGVDLFAPSHLYGEPDDLRRFVDRAHGLGMGVLLDVVYNHLGPDGNYLAQFSDSFFSRRHPTDWGDAINFDGEGSGPVRDFYLANAGYWIEELHLDGLRLDATQDIHDDSADNIFVALARRVREAGGRRRTYLVAENEPQEARLVRPDDPRLPPARRGHGLDAIWNDDFHHAAAVALTGRREAYYTDYRGTPQELVSTAKRGFLYQGQRYAWQRQRRGAPALDLPPAAFVHYLENHDQLANSAHGLRLHQMAGAGQARALTALLLLGPQTPLLFQGQEFWASSPFLYFADHGPELAAKVRAGRLDSLRQFASSSDPEAEAAFLDPASPVTFARCKLDPAERRRNGAAVALHRDLLRLRREDPVFRLQGSGGIDGAVLGAQAFVLRFFGDAADGDRLLVVNLGQDLELVPAPEPLLAPLAGLRWRAIWSSESPRYGCGGAVEPEGVEGWWLTGHAAHALAPAPRAERPRPRRRTQFPARQNDGDD
ncbi:MAG TPA: malto-oligosyltrehalose trehalohydrolase [Thermoanaerobaculia bacterium]|nr:malto-oligosyltrehalose trehalohydrolase [Thermoanaerobaculia bacterium]